MWFNWVLTKLAFTSMNTRFVFKSKNHTYLPDQKGSNFMIFIFPNPYKLFVLLRKMIKDVCWVLSFNDIEHMLFFFCYSICGLWRMYRDFKWSIRERVVFCWRMLYTLWWYWWYLMLHTNTDNNFGICVHRSHYRSNYNDYSMLCDLSLQQQEETSTTTRWSSSASERKGSGKTKKIDDGPFCQWRSFSNNGRNRW